MKEINKELLDLLRFHQIPNLQSQYAINGNDTLFEASVESALPRTRINSVTPRKDP
jgi:hypothetical protein